MLEVYEETPVFIPIDMTENVVKSITQKLLGRAGPGCTDSEALQGCVIKVRKHRKTLYSCGILHGMYVQSEPTIGRLSGIYV